MRNHSVLTLGSILSIFGTLVLPTQGMATSFTAISQTVATTGDSNGGDSLECTGPSRITFIDSSGKEVGPGNPTAATVYWFGDPVEGRVIVPPPDFDFARASDAQLYEWGYPPREDDVDWTTVNGRLKPEVSGKPPEMCTAPGVQANDSPNTIWAGVVAKTSTENFVRVYGTARVPSFDVPGCGSNAGLAVWSGIGNNGLIQNGWATMNSFPEGMFPWWEFIGPNGDNSGNFIKFLRFGQQAFTGELVKSYTWFDRSTDPDVVRFNWTNISTGVVEPPYEPAFVAGNDGLAHSVGHYYDGSQAELISEKFTVAPLRQFSDPQGWKDMYAARPGIAAMPIGNYSYDIARVVRPNTNQNLMHVHANSLTSPTQMNVIWDACS